MTETRRSKPRSCVGFPKCLLGQTNSTYFPLLDVYSRILPFIIFGTISMVAAVLSVLLPDTRNSKLPDVISEARPIRWYAPACGCHYQRTGPVPFLTCLCLPQSFGCLKKKQSPRILQDFLRT